MYLILAKDQNNSSDEGENMPKSREINLLYLGVCACFLLSGFAALLYQTAWMRQFSTVFGTSELAIATVLSAYMGGLALGAALAGKYIVRVTRPVFTYGVLEAAVAASALMVPLLLGLASWAYSLVLGGQPEPPDASGLGQPIFYFIVAFIVLAMPTACMGATLPLLTRYVVTAESQIGTRVGALYAINTAGAVIGTLVAAFVLLPMIGLQGTVWIGVAVNFLVFCLAVLIAKRMTDSPQHLPEETQTDSPQPELSPGWLRSNLILPIMLFSGTTSFVYEVLWTRLLSHILGGSVAAFATMLASFLSGIAIGSAVASRWATSSARSIQAFVIVQLFIAFTSIAIYQWLHLLIPSEEGLRGNVGIAIAILLPATLFIGATFPLAVRIYATSAQSAARSSARVYSWNTVGAIFGAAFAGFFLIPALKYEGTIKAVVLTNMFLALVMSFFIAHKRPMVSGAISLVFVGILFAYQPHMPEQILRSSPIDGRAEGEILYYDVGRSSTVLMTSQDGILGLRNNGLPEAGTAFRGSPPQRDTQVMLATLPSVIRPDAESMLIVGFGGGNAVTGVSPGVTEIDVIELEPRVIDAVRLTAELSQNEPLADPRLNLYINDARSALSLTEKSYDAIISQPSHPWTAGASHLYTREYMQLAADHLTNDGVFLQWMAAEFLTESLFRSLCATMLEVFDHMKVYQLFPGVLFFVGSQQPIEAELEMVQTGRPIEDYPVFYYQRGIASAEDLLAGLFLDTEGARRFSAGASLLTDNFNRMATNSAPAVESGNTLGLPQLTELMRPYVPLLDSESWVHGDLSDSLNFAYISERYEVNGLSSYGVELAEALGRQGNWQSLLITGLGLRKQGDAQAASVLEAALDAAPEDNRANWAHFALIEPWLPALAAGNAPARIVEVANSLTGPAGAVLAGQREMASNNWYAVAELDQYFAQSRPTDPWFLESTKLMIEWRNNIANIERRTDLAEQARYIIDIAIALNPVPDLYAARAAAAYFADRPNELLETGRRLTYVIERELDVIEELNHTADEALLTLRQGQLEAIRAAMQDASSRHVIRADTLEEIFGHLQELQTRLTDTLSRS